MTIMMIPLFPSFFIFINSRSPAQSIFRFGGTWHAVGPLPLTFVLLLVMLPTKSTSNNDIPDIVACCRNRGLSAYCVENLCQPPSDPENSEFTAFQVPALCAAHLKDAAQCIADGRNHSTCCRSTFKGVDANCLHLCEGTANKDDTSKGVEYNGYVSCLTFNTISIFACARKGYTRIPGPPVNLTLVNHTTTTTTYPPNLLDLVWERPQKLPDKVTGYSIYYEPEHANSKDDNAFPILAGTTTKTTFRISNLNANTKYAIYVIAHGGQAGDSGEKENSLPSDPLYFTWRIAPSVEPYQKQIVAVVNDSKTLVCKIHVNGTKRRPMTVLWQHRLSDNRPYESVSYNLKYQATLYASNEKNRQDSENSRTEETRHSYVATLFIRKITSTDFGTYRCLVKTNFGESHAELVMLKPKAPTLIPAAPPNVTECCLRQRVKITCLHACQSKLNDDPGDSSKAYKLTNGGAACSTEASKIARCSSSASKSVDWNTGACCLRRKVPPQCLSLCENGASGSPFIPASPEFGGGGFLLRNAATAIFLTACQAHTNVIFECVLEERSKIPYPPTELIVKSVNDQRGTVVLEWQPSQMADAYHIFYREISNVGAGGSATPGAWSRTTVSHTSTTLNNLKPRTKYAVSILSANSAGFSDSSRPLTFTTN